MSPESAALLVEAACEWQVTGRYMITPPLRHSVFTVFTPSAHASACEWQTHEMPPKVGGATLSPETTSTLQTHIRDVLRRALRLADAPPHSSEEAVT